MSTFSLVVLLINIKNNTFNKNFYVFWCTNPWWVCVQKCVSVFISYLYFGKLRIIKPLQFPSLMITSKSTGNCNCDDSQVESNEKAWTILLNTLFALVLKYHAIIIQGMECEEKHIKILFCSLQTDIFFISTFFCTKLSFVFFNFSRKTFLQSEKGPKKNWKKSLISCVTMRTAVSNRKKKEKNSPLSLLESFNFKQKQNKPTQQRHHHHFHYHFPENYKVYSLKTTKNISAIIWWFWYDMWWLRTQLK